MCRDTSASATLVLHRESTVSQHGSHRRPTRYTEFTRLSPPGSQLPSLTLSQATSPDICSPAPTISCLNLGSRSRPVLAPLSVSSCSHIFSPQAAGLLSSLWYLSSGRLTAGHLITWYQSLGCNRFPNSIASFGFPRLLPACSGTAGSPTFCQSFLCCPSPVPPAYCSLFAPHLLFSAHISLHFSSLWIEFFSLGYGPSFLLYNFLSLSANFLKVCLKVFSHPSVHTEIFMEPGSGEWIWSSVPQSTGRQGRGYK